MRRNPKEKQGYNTVKYLLKFDGNDFEKVPYKFWCKQVGEWTKETDQPQRGMVISNEGLTIETRAKLDFAINDLVLDDLELYDEGYTPDGIPYKNKNRINRVVIESDSDYSLNSMRFKNNNNKIYKLDIG